MTDLSERLGKLAGPMRVLVCGGRDFNDKIAVWGFLQAVHLKRGIASLICGGARGADDLAYSWAVESGVPCKRFMADWNAHGKSAGPKRNQRMIDEGKPDLVIAFPGGRGTADMVRRAEAAGIAIRQFPAPYGGK